MLFLYADENAEDLTFEDDFLKRGGREMELRRRKDNGEVFWVRLQLSQLKDELGQPDGLIAFLSDVTERRNSVEQISLYSRIFGQSEKGVLITDAQEKIVFVNKAFTRITGYAEREVIGETPTKFSSAGTMPLFSRTCGSNCASSATGPARPGIGARMGRSIQSGCRSAPCTMSPA